MAKENVIHIVSTKIDSAQKHYASYTDGDTQPLKAYRLIRSDLDLAREKLFAGDPREHPTELEQIYNLEINVADKLLTGDLLTAESMQSPWFYLVDFAKSYGLIKKIADPDMKQGPEGEIKDRAQDIASKMHEYYLAFILQNNNFAKKDGDYEFNRTTAIDAIRAKLGDFDLETGPALASIYNATTVNELLKFRQHALLYASENKYPDITSPLLQAQLSSIAQKADELSQRNDAEKPDFEQVAEHTRAFASLAYI
jgi:hypothetical protein